ncbi:hypothetical protein PFBG_03180 [Plasmodium falciparum 7G8]|uniref:Uncharacterized protein n=1 Tax=Plasmodium falciparum (isolate 7G8) TaxID=57266 RepID=W7EZR2_PLAF8|nr:hypothetical protein PFBG_03180 [Plasmodium falciparum 7G8]
MNDMRKYDIPFDNDLDVYIQRNEIGNCQGDGNKCAWDWLSGSSRIVSHNPTSSRV